MVKIVDGSCYQLTSVIVLKVDVGASARSLGTTREAKNPRARWRSAILL